MQYLLYILFGFFYPYNYLLESFYKTQVGVLVMNTKRKIGPVKSAIENIEEMLKRLDCKVEEIRQVNTGYNKCCSGTF